MENLLSHVREELMIYLYRFWFCFFRNLFKGIEKIHFEIFDQVNIVFQIEILLIDENFF
jgi:hypothetical protein